MSRLYEALQKCSLGEQDAVRNPTPRHAQPEAVPIQVSDAAAWLDAVPTLTIPAHPENRLVVLWQERSAGAEKIRILATRLAQLQNRRRLKTLLITSSVKDEGKSVVAANLAITLARRGSKHVLLVDGDCRQRALGVMLGVCEPGLTNAWHQQADLLSLLRRCEDFPMWMLPAGRILEQPLEMLHSPWLPNAIAGLDRHFDWIVIDSPPVAPVADSSVWAALCDGALLVARSGKTPAKVLAKVAESIGKEKLVGLVLNDCADNGDGYYGDYYYHSNGGTVSGKAS